MDSKIPQIKIFNFLIKHYGSKISNFISLILFNNKSHYVYAFYKKVVKIGLAWLVCVSGFHLHIINNLIKFIFKWNKYIKIIVSKLLLLFYIYLSSFSYSLMRAYLFICINEITRHKLNKLNLLGIVALIICYTNTNCFIKYSFSLSILGSFSIIFINQLPISNFIIKNILIAVYINLITLPLVATFNRFFSVFSIINSFILLIIFEFVYLYFIFSAWLVFLKQLHMFIIIFFEKIITNF